jgi:hypothetical protein
LNAEGALGGSSPEPSSSIGETGQIELKQGDGSNWYDVTLDGSYNDPVVLMKPLSYNGSDQSHIRLRNVSGGSFEFKIEEWDYLDGWHMIETMSYAVFESGTHTLSDGTQVVVGTTTVDHQSSSVSFPQSFDTTPVVMSQPQTFVGSDAIVTRNWDISTGGFTVQLQEQESRGWHYGEAVGYVAIEPNTGTNDGSKYEVGRTAEGVTDDWYSVSFAQSYENPLFLADMQTRDGSDSAGIRYQNLSNDTVDMMIEEEQSKNNETAHLPESVGYVVFDGSGPIPGS